MGFLPDIDGIINEVKQGQAELLSVMREMLAELRKTNRLLGEDFEDPESVR